MSVTRATLLGSVALTLVACTSFAEESTAREDDVGSGEDRRKRERDVEAPAAETDTDSDGDGISDVVEARVAAESMPYVSLDANDSCPTRGIAFRVSKHPQSPGRLMVWGVVLYDRDCGLTDHAGDDEAFSVVVDPTKSGAASILAVRTIGHQGTFCQKENTCGVCTGMTACTTADGGGGAYPVIFSSLDKHANFLFESACDSSYFCDIGGCQLRPAAELASARIPMVNVGEPSRPLVRNLTTQGFIRAELGWKSTELMNVDPWRPGKFGGAGDLANDFVDPALVIDVTSCR
jgi:hypothetical protein